MQVAVDVDGPGRYLEQQYVGPHQRRIRGALATIGMSMSIGRSTSSSTRTFSRTGSMGRFSPARSLGVDLWEVETAVADATAAAP